VTAQSILAQAEAAGLTLRPNGDNIGIKPVARLTPELKQAITACKPEVLALLRTRRQAEVSTAFAESFARLGNLYDGDLVGSLWARIVAQHPALAHVVDVAEQAADTAALAYQSGTAAGSSQFLIAMAAWEARWAEAIAAITSRACSDCGRTDATIMVTTDTGRFCRACLRPEPLNAPPKTRGTHA
jgi:hypothetical protein